MSERDKNDGRYADPDADKDPRTSDEGYTSVGSSDVDADAAKVPLDTPAVRRGDEDTPRPQSTPTSVNTKLDGDVMDQADLKIDKS